MACTKRKCVGINLVKRWDNHKWFSRVHANTLLSCGMNPWSPTLTKVLLEHKQPLLTCGESWRVASTRETQLLWGSTSCCTQPLETTWTASALVTLGTHVVLMNLWLCLCNLSHPQLGWVEVSTVTLQPQCRTGCKWLLWRLDVKGWCVLGDLVEGNGLAQWLQTGPGNRNQQLTAPAFPGSHFINYYNLT